MKTNTKITVYSLVLISILLAGIYHATIINMVSDYIATHGVLMFISQVVISCLGIPAIYLSQSKNYDVYRLSPLFGLAGQPFWFMMAYVSSAWGVFIMSMFYTHAWYTGFKNHWLTKEDSRKRFLGNNQKAFQLERLSICRTQLPHLNTDQLTDLINDIEIIKELRSGVRVKSS